ncbi:MAG: hypothetical protein QM709_01815 [Spongiibacteraceae bacterium]
MQLSAQKKIFILVALFWSTLFWRSPALFLSPRFWAEEGKYYYSNLQDENFFSTFTLIIRGNFQLLTNWIAYFATLVPAKFAAYVSTYISLLLLGFFAGLVGLLSIQRNWPPLLSGIVIVILALLPQGYEIYLTGTNVQWICPACLLVISLLDTKDWSSSRKIAIYIFAAISGLTGVCSAMLAPAFILRKCISPSQFHFKIGLILSCCAVLHGVIILANAHPDRTFPLDLFILTFPLALQSIWSPLIGGEAVDRVVILLGKEGYGILNAAIYVASLSLAAFAIFTARNKLKHKYIPFMLFGIWLGVSVLNVFGSLGDQNGLISGWAGGRYFFLGAVCFVIMLGFAASGESTIASKFALLLLITMMLSSIKQAHSVNWKNGLISGESWYARVSRCEDIRPCDVEVWPGGTNWSFQLKHK